MHEKRIRDALAPHIRELNANVNCGSLLGSHPQLIVQLILSKDGWKLGRMYPASNRVRQYFWPSPEEWEEVLSYQPPQYQNRTTYRDIITAIRMHGNRPFTAALIRPFVADDAYGRAAAREIMTVAKMLEETSQGQYSIVKLGHWHDKKSIPSLRAQYRFCKTVSDGRAASQEPLTHLAPC